MSEIIGCRKVWNFYDSTGTGEAYQTDGIARHYTFYLETLGSSRSTAHVAIQTARSTEGSTVARWVDIGSTSQAPFYPSTFAMSSAALVVARYEGPFLAVRPYVQSLGATGALGSTGTHVRVELVGN